MNPQHYYLYLINEVSKALGRKVEIRYKEDCPKRWKFLSFVLNLFVYYLPYLFYKMSGQDIEKVDLLNKYYNGIGFTVWVPSRKALAGLSEMNRNMIISHEVSHILMMSGGSPDITKVAPLNWFWRTWNQCRYLFQWFPVKYATYRQQVELEGFKTEAGLYFVETGNILNRRYYEDLFSGSTYGWMATKKQATKLSHQVVDHINEHYLKWTNNNL